MCDFSIIICTYNPDTVLLNRLVEAVYHIKYSTDKEIEVIVVDNNSNPPVREKIKNEFGLCYNYIVEQTAGLTYARLAGFNNSSGDWIIFFDDDNDPSADYLQVLKKIIKQYPEVGCWGPGVINVEIQSKKIEPWVEQQKNLFQQRNTSNISFDDKKMWQDCYPFGTGLCVRREIMKVYLEQIQSQQYTLSDRKGKSLSSGGDVQIVLTGIKMGFKAGVIPELKMNHLIKANKATLSYLQKQCFGTASAYLLAHEQVFPEHPFQNDLLSNKQILYKVYSLFRNHFFVNGSHFFRLKLASTIGEINARYLNAKAKPAVLIRWYKRMINA